MTGAIPPPYPTLFSPVRLGPLEVPNRLVFPAHLTNLAQDNLPSAAHAAYYEARAAGGAGLIIMEDQAVHPTDLAYARAVHAHRPEVVRGYTAVTRAVHRHGARILAQLGHNGAQGGSGFPGRPLWAPSPLADPAFREVPYAMGPAEIDELVTAFARAARHCAEGGFDGIELQASHSSVLRAFLSPLTNRRDDGYGGGLRARARLLLEVAEAVREAVGSGLAVGVRLCADEFTDGGLTVDDAVATARLLAEAGTVDYLNTSLGVATTHLEAVEPSMHVAPGYALHASAAIRRAVALPVVGVGRIRHPAHAERALAQGDCDLVGIVRGQIADPDFGRKARAGRDAAIRTCVSCNQECAGRVGLDRTIACVVNPEAGRESRPSVPPPPRASRRVLVVGAGPAGLAAAEAAAVRGHRVTVVEREREPGGLVRHAARLPGRAEFGDLVRDQLRALVGLPVEILTATTATPELVGAADWDAVVIATGGRPAPAAWAPADDPRIVPLRAVLSGTIRPAGRVVLVDEVAFHQASGTAELLAARGCHVTLVTPDFQAAGGLGLTLDLPGWRIRAARAGITVRTAALPTGMTADGIRLLHYLSGATVEEPADWVVLATPELPDDHLYRTAPAPGPTVLRAGDCVAPRRADAAVREGREAGRRV